MPRDLTIHKISTATLRRFASMCVLKNAHGMPSYMLIPCIEDFLTGKHYPSNEGNKPFRWLECDFKIDSFILDYFTILVQIMSMTSHDVTWEMNMNHVDDISVADKIKALENMPFNILNQILLDYVYYLKNFYWANTSRELLQIATIAFSGCNVIGSLEQTRSNLYAANEAGFTENIELHNMLPHSVRECLVSKALYSFINNTTVDMDEIKLWSNVFKNLHTAHITRNTPPVYSIKLDNINTDSVNITSDVIIPVKPIHLDPGKYIFNDLGLMYDSNQEQSGNFGLCTLNEKKYMYKRFDINKLGMPDTSGIFCGYNGHYNKYENNEGPDTEIAVSDRICHLHTNFTPIVSTISEISENALVIMNIVEGPTLGEFALTAQKDLLIIQLAHVMATIDLLSRYGILHINLNKSNIIIEHTDDDYIDYNVGDNKFVSIPTMGYHPVIIDFNNAYVEGYSAITNQSFGVGWALTGISKPISVYLAIMLVFYRIYMSSRQNPNAIEIVHKMFIFFDMLTISSEIQNIATTTDTLKEYIVDIYDTIRSEDNTNSYKSSDEWIDLICNIYREPIKINNMC